MDRKHIRILRDQLTDALANFASETGLEVVIGSRATFTAHQVTFKLSLCERVDGHIMTPEAWDFQAKYHRFGMARSDLWKKFMYGEKEYTIIGLRTKAKKRPIIAESKGGEKRYLPVHIVRARLDPDYSH